MSNSEYHQQMKKGKWEPKKPRTTANCSTDLPFSPDNEFVELLWENGQIVMQGQNNKPKKNPVSTMLPSNLTSNGEDAMLPIPPKGGKFGPLEIVAQEFSSGTSAAVGLVQDDDLVPWLNCPFDYSLEREYCSEFLAQMSMLNKNSMSAQTSSAVSDKTATLSNSVMLAVQNCANLEPENSYKESSLVSDLNAAATGSSRDRSCESIHSAQSQVSTQGARSKPIDFCADDSFRAPPQHSTPMPVSVITPHSIKPIHSAAKALEPVHSGSMMNFCHFSLPAALSKSHLQSVGMAANVPVTNPFRKNNRLIDADNKTVESSVVDSNSLKQIGSCFKQMNGCNKMFSFQHPLCELLSWKDMNLGDKMPTHVLPHIDAEDVGCQEDLAGRCRASDQKLSHSPSFAANTAAVGSSNGGKAIEPVVGSSSVCSGSSAGRSVEDAKHVPKRNSKEIEESGYHSEDVEEESVGARKPSTSKSTSTKRSRAAEVHNLSERRRRDRINEKMRALQELIPNCNKTDKASMLDEAIEYLKTLQLQVQMMSMGSGMCIPPMMLPAGMRHMHFSPGGVGMGMGYGMGMVDMGCSSACPMIRMPPMHGSPSLPCIPGSGVPVFGVPGHGLPVAMPRAQFMPFPVFPAKPVSLPETSGATAMMPAFESVPLSTSKSSPDDVNIVPVNYSNSQQIQKTQGTEVNPQQYNTTSITHQIGHSMVNPVLKQSQTDGAAASAEDRSD